MNKKRLLKLADLLEADAKNKKGIKFNMGDWGTITDPARPLSCRTQACAMGLAALSGAFARSGLSAEIEESSIWFVLGKKRTSDGYWVASQFFDITGEEATFLFASYAYGGREGGAVVERAVAKRIRDFTAGKVSA